MEDQKKNTAFLYLFGVIIVCFIALRIFQVTVSDEEEKTNQAVANSNVANASIEENFQLLLEIRAPFSNTSIQIYNEGQITYQKIVFGLQEDSQQEKTINQEKLINLQNLISSSQFFSMNSAYRSQEIVEDSTFSILSISWDEDDHSVLCETNCPDGFNSIQTQVESLWNNI